MTLQVPATGSTKEQPDAQVVVPRAWITTVKGVTVHCDIALLGKGGAGSRGAKGSVVLKKRKGKGGKTTREGIPSECRNSVAKQLLGPSAINSKPTPHPKPPPTPPTHHPTPNKQPNPPPPTPPPEPHPPPQPKRPPRHHPKKNNEECNLGQKDCNPRLGGKIVSPGE